MESRKLEFPMSGKFWRYICARLGLSSKELAFQIGYLSGRVDAVLAKEKMRGSAAAALCYVCQHFGFDLLDLLKESKEMWTLREIAEESRVSYSTVIRWVKSGKIEVSTKKPIFIHTNELIKIIAWKMGMSLEDLLPTTDTK